MRLALILSLMTFSLFARNAHFNTYPIIQEGHPTLRLEATDLVLSDIHTPGFKKLIKDMFTTMKRNVGVGLAAPQINISQSLFVMGGFLTGVKKRVMVNPDVELLGGPSKISNEGCLSTVDYGNRKVPRHKRVLVKYHDENGQYLEKEFGGFTAIVIQHEFDHLKGRLIIDYDQDHLNYLWDKLEPVEIPYEL